MYGIGVLKNTQRMNHTLISSCEHVFLVSCTQLGTTQEEEGPLCLLYFLKAEP